MRRPTDKHFRLVCWSLTYDVPPDVRDIEPHIGAACDHAKMALREFQQARRKWPREFAKVLAKRERRRKWLKRHRTIRPGWTPTDPRDGRTGNFPHAALAARRRVRSWKLRRLLVEYFPEHFAK